MATTYKIFQRDDKKYAWHLKSGTDIIATDGSQGYNNEADCRKMITQIIGGTYGDATEER